MESAMFFHVEKLSPSQCPVYWPLPANVERERTMDLFPGRTWRTALYSTQRLNTNVWSAFPFTHRLVTLSDLPLRNDSLGVTVQIVDFVVKALLTCVTEFGHHTDGFVWESVRWSSMGSHYYLRGQKQKKNCTILFDLVICVLIPYSFRKADRPIRLLGIVICRCTDWYRSCWLHSYPRRELNEMFVVWELLLRFEILISHDPKSIKFELLIKQVDLLCPPLFGGLFEEIWKRCFIGWPHLNV
jgi:hypothetical protein